MKFGLTQTIAGIGVYLLVAILGLAQAGQLIKFPDTIEGKGDKLQYTIGGTALASTALHRDGYGAAQYLLSIGSTALITEGLKRVIRSSRPNGSPHSFPSGHTAFAFSSATFLQVRYGACYGIPAYLTAAFIGYSRIFADKHRLRDVIAGAAIGTLMGMLFTRRFRPFYLSVYYYDDKARHMRRGVIRAGVTW